MTTDLQVLRAANVFIDNDVLHLRQRTGGLDLAGVAWLALGDRPHDAHQRSLDFAVSLVTTRLVDHALWLLAGHSAWLPDSRVTRYRKLWGSLNAGGLVTPWGREVSEGFVEATQGVRFFGALQLDLGGSLEPVVAILEAQPVSHLVVLRPSDETMIKKLVADGWERTSFGPSTEILGAVCSRDGVVLWPVGAFDDREAGCVAIGKTQILDQLLGTS